MLQKHSSSAHPILPPFCSLDDLSGEDENNSIECEKVISIAPAAVVTRCELCALWIVKFLSSTSILIPDTLTCTAPNEISREIWIASNLSSSVRKWPTTRRNGEWIDRASKKRREKSANIQKKSRTNRINLSSERWNPFSTSEVKRICVVAHTSNLVQVVLMLALVQCVQVCKSVHPTSFARRDRTEWHTTENDPAVLLQQMKRLRIAAKLINSIKLHSKENLRHHQRFVCESSKLSFFFFQFTKLCDKFEILAILSGYEREEEEEKKLNPNDGVSSSRKSLVGLNFRLYAHKFHHRQDTESRYLSAFTTRAAFLSALNFSPVSRLELKKNQSKSAISSSLSLSLFSFSAIQNALFK